MYVVHWCVGWSREAVRDWFCRIVVHVVCDRRVVAV